MKSLYLFGILVLSVLLGYMLYRNIFFTEKKDNAGINIHFIEEKIKTIENLHAPANSSIQKLEKSIYNTFMDKNKFGAGNSPDNPNIEAPKLEVYQIQNAIDSLLNLKSAFIVQNAAMGQLKAELATLEEKCIKPARTTAFSFDSTMGIVSLIIGILSLWIAFRQEVRQLSNG